MGFHVLDASCPPSTSCNSLLTTSSVEILRFHLKPSGFFDRNPGLDVPSIADAKSRFANEAFANGTTNGATNGESCCAR